jgi:hypothetical protein
MDISNLLNNINLIYNRKKYIENLIENKSTIIKDVDLNKTILKQFNIIYTKIKDTDKYKSNLVSGNKYNAVKNNGGGDCFFYSLIDSGIPVTYKGENLNKKYKNNDKEFVLALRAITIDRINWTKPNVDTSQMMNSTYWADNIMIAALSAEIDVMPILIESYNNQIYCGIVTKVKYESESKITYKTHTRKVKFTNINKLKKSKDRFVLIYYQTAQHFEAVYTKTNNHYIKYFDGFNKFEQHNPEMAKHIINKCNFQTKAQAENDVLDALINSLAK